VDRHHPGPGVALVSSPEHYSGAEPDCSVEMRRAANSASNAAPASSTRAARSPSSLADLGYAAERSWKVEAIISDLSRALQALAHEPVVTKDGPHPPISVEPTARPDTGVVLHGRATSVPFTAVLNGPQRTTTDNTTTAPASIVACPRR
jgi:hypothetical protein